MQNKEISKEELLQWKENRKSEREATLREYWNTVRTPFNSPDDIPELPKASKEEWDNYYVPILISRGAIPKKELVKGYGYIGNCRNTDYVVWNGEVFEYTRYKFGTSYQETINHFEDDNGFDLFVPIKDVD